MSAAIKLLSIQVGLPTEHGTQGAEDPLQRPWVSSIFKYPVMGAVRVGKTNIEGDAQADLKAHGGPDKAVMAYSAAHYAYWQRDLPEKDWVYGGFGENLTITGLDETQVCIGDVYALGEVRLEVTQPRAPCWKLARRWLQKDLTARVEQTGYTGWYFRVLQEGEISAGLPVERLQNPHPEWTIRHSAYVMRHYKEDPAAAHALSQLPALAQSWRAYLEKKLR